MGIITGPATTGKTEFIVTILQPSLNCTASGTTPKNSTTPQVLICTDKLGGHIYERAQGNVDSRHAVIIRMYSLSTENGVLDNEAHKSQLEVPEQATYSDVGIADLVVASMVFKAYHESKARKYRGINDRRYILHNMSLAMWMLRISGVLADPDRTLANPKQHRTFANLFSRVAEGGEDLDPKEWKIFGEARQLLQQHTISLAHVLITTVSNSGDASIATFFKPCLAIVDEAARAIEADMWNILGNHPEAALVMIGDDAQLRTTVISSRDQNSLGGSLRLSMFNRFKMLGHSLNPAIKISSQISPVLGKNMLVLNIRH